MSASVSLFVKLSNLRKTKNSVGEYAIFNLKDKSRVGIIVDYSRGYTVVNGV